MPGEVDGYEGHGHQGHGPPDVHGPGRVHIRPVVGEGQRRHCGEYQNTLQHNTYLFFFMLDWLSSLRSVIHSVIHSSVDYNCKSIATRYQLLIVISVLTSKLKLFYECYSETSLVTQVIFSLIFSFPSLQ